MSQIKRINLGLIIILAIASFFMFGCEKSTPVKDIAFNLNEGEQIVLMVGQELEMKDYISIKPTYASNKKYSIISFDENVVRVENKKLLAVAEGNTQIKVVSDDNNLKEDLMTVIVKKTKTVLNAPLNLTYSNITKSFTFDAVPYASSYTLRINGEDYDLGNSTVFNLNQYRAKAYDELLVVQVKANAPSYTFALESSSFTNEYKIYQAGELKNVSIKNGVLNFVKSSSDLKVNVYLNDGLILNQTSDVYVSLKRLDSVYAGMSTQVHVESVVGDAIKTQYGNDVEYFNSSKQTVNLNVLDVVNISYASNVISWSNVAYSAGYAIYVDGVEKIRTENNYFDLTNLTDCDEIFEDGRNHNVKVEPLIDNNSVNVGKTIAENPITVKRLSKTDISCREELIVWEDVDGASYYAVSLSHAGSEIKTSMVSTSMNLTGYDPGEYTIMITAVPGVSDNGGICYLSSEVEEFKFNKLAMISAQVVGYKLIVSNLNDDKCLVDFSADGLKDEMLDGSLGQNELSLEGYDFNADNHSITLTRVGDENSVHSDKFVWNFTQLEKIDKITISNGIASVVRSQANENAIITFVTTGTGLPEPLIITSDTFAYNTIDEGEGYLSSGTYETAVYVYGDGGSTFSYRENGSVVACAAVQFEVLPAPTIELTNSSEAKITIGEVVNASSYNLYEINDTIPYVITNLELGSGETGYYTAQAKGNATNILPDGSLVPCYLDSCYSEPITVTRLVTPVLTYNNVTKVLYKEDNNDSTLIRDYLLTKNGEETNYDFESALNLVEDTQFILTLVAEKGSGGAYYLNSLPDELNLTKISNDAEIELDALNNLIIKPNNHMEQYDLIVKFDLGGGDVLEFTTLEEFISNGEYNLNCGYSNGVYAIQLIENYNTIIEEMGDNFSVEIQFVKSSTGNDTVINSETVSKDLALTHLDSTSTITTNNNNQIVITPANLTKECGLVIVINDNENLSFKSNGENLVLNEVELPYIYDADKSSYYIDIQDSAHNFLHEAFGEDFKIKVKYTNLINSTPTDLDSDFTENTTIYVQNVSTLSRDGQSIKFTKAYETDIYSDYLLLITNQNSGESFKLEIVDGMTTIHDGFFTMDVDYIYQSIDNRSWNRCDIYSISVITLNDEESLLTPNISNKSNELLIQKAQTVEINAIKNNNESNNAVVINFETINTEYSKEYIVEFYDETNKHIEQRLDQQAVLGEISFNLDEIIEESEVELSGTIHIRVFVSTSDNYTDEKIIYVFNSDYSNVLSLDEVDAVGNLRTSGSFIVFDEVENAVGYEVYEVLTGGIYAKLNTSLLTANQFEITTTGTKEIVVKTISAVGYSNSKFSESIKVNKLAEPQISVENGKFKIVLPSDITTLLIRQTLGLIPKGTINIIPEVLNGQNEKITVDLDDSSDDISIDLLASTLICEPSLFLSYNTANIVKETLKVQIRFEQTKAIDDVYYLDLNTVEIGAHGLFKPLNVSKTTNEDTYVESIVWEWNGKNIIMDGDAKNTIMKDNVGYIFKIEHTLGETTKTYYSNDEKLKYKDGETFKSYPSVISGTSVIFPAGYGEGETLDEQFNAGTFKVSVKTVPTSAVAGYNLCNSEYSKEYVFEMLNQVHLSVQQGQIYWDNQENAGKYEISIYAQGETEPLLVETVNKNLYNFSTDNLKGYDGVMKVVVKSIGKANDILNSVESEPIYVYKLPEALSVSVDDGHLILTSTKFFSMVTIDFVDKSSGVVYGDFYDNATVADESLDNLNIKTWEGFIDDDLIKGEDAIVKTAIKLDENVLTMISGSDYEINVTLIGNSISETGFVNSATSICISDLVATKLKANANGIRLGTIQFKPHSDYATITQNPEDELDVTYANSIDLNYSFNGGTSLSAEFWKKTVIYKIKISHFGGETIIYAVDYFSFVSSFDLSQTSTEFELLDNMNSLFAVLKYSYGESQVINFNVYKNNVINLKDFDTLSYYNVSEHLENGENHFESDGTLNSIDLTTGGSFAITVSMLGGDSYVDNGITVGHINSNENVTETFVRYGQNQLSTQNGKLKFDDLKATIHNEETEEDQIIDYPVYQIIVERANLESDTLTFYLYYDLDENSLANAQSVVEKLDKESLETAQFFSVETDEEIENALLFNLGDYVTSGSYIVSIRTIAGIGSNGAYANYLLNAKVPTVKYTIHKLTDVTVQSNDGVFQFDQASIQNDSQFVYASNYEITIIDGENEYVYEIGAHSDGVSINNTNHSVTYALPAQIKVGEEYIPIREKDEYQIKVRAISKSNPILNGTYKTNATEDETLTFSKSLGVSNVAIKDGVLIWKVQDLENYSNVEIKLSFLEEFEVRNIYIKTSGTRINDDNGNYQYHYYEFLDIKYNYETAGSNYILSDTVYSVSMHVIGSGNILNSDYSSPIRAERLSYVDSENIRTENGILTWDEVENADSYEITITGVQGKISTSTNMFDVAELNLVAGDYKISIRAIGDTYITSLPSGEATGFVQLGVVDTSTIRFENLNIVWNPIENADGYIVRLDYKDGETDTFTESVVETNTFTPPSEMAGMFTITIAPISIGTGKAFNGKPASYTSTNSRPTQVQSLSYDAENQRFVIQVNNADFYEGDSILITYNLEAYISNEGVGVANQKTETISWKDATTTTYYYPITIIGKYSDISVQVIRQNTFSSDAVVTTSVDFKLFGYGAGTEENPYMLYTADQLLNIRYFPHAHFKFSNSINMNGVNVQQRLANFGGIIADNFTGVLDGNGCSIFGFNKLGSTDTISLSNQTNFRLFENLEGTIKDLTIGEEDANFVITNTISDTSITTINIAIIATNAIGATLENINVKNFQITISSAYANSSIKYAGKIYIAGLINNVTNTTIKSSNVNINTAINIALAEESNVEVSVGGIAIKSTTSTINGCDVIFGVQTSNANNILTRIGGLVAESAGSASKSSVITNSTVAFTVENVKSQYVGGLVAYSKHTTITSCETTGYYKQTDIKYNTYIGGLVGRGEYTNIITSGSLMNFELEVSNTQQTQRIGSIVGYLTGDAENMSEITNCYSNLYDEANLETKIQLGTITVGMYGKLIDASASGWSKR